MNKKKLLLKQPALFACLMLMILVLFSQCKTAATQNRNSAPIRVLMVGGGSSHDFDRWYKAEDAQTIAREGLATVTYTDNTDSIAHYLKNTDLLLLTNNQPIKEAANRQAIFDFVNSGKGLVLAHAALWYNWKDWPEYNKQLVSGGSRGHDRYGSFNVTVTNENHPVMKGVEKNFTLKDELYYFKVDSSAAGITELARASAPGSDKSFPSVFVINHPKARIVGIALGHDAESHTISPYQTILRNSIRWAAKK